MLATLTRNHLLVITLTLLALAVILFVLGAPIYDGG